MNSIKEVVIIGAGVSGIAAATRLFENGIQNILVIEAENRIGGRVNTVDLAEGEGFIELGAQWIHGEEKNVVFEMASPRNIIFNSDSTFDNQLYIRSSSEIVDQKKGAILWDQFQRIKYSVDEETLKTYKSSGEYFSHKLSDAFEKINSDCLSEDLQKEFIEWCHNFINSVDGSDSWFDSAVSTLTEYWECPGNNLIAWKKGGYRTLLSILMEKSENISNGSFAERIIVKNSPVQKISMQDNVLQIKCKNGTVYLANHVIVTVSLGVLKKRYKEMFEGILLPKEKILAIENLGIGTVNKIYLKFPYQWWPKDISGFSLLWNSNDKEVYAKEGKEWLTDVFAFSRVDNAPNMLCGWITGPSARTMELIDKTEIQMKLLQILKKFVGNHFSIPSPEYCVRSAWSSNEYFSGSYSFRTPASDELGVSSCTLSSPIINKNGNPILLFAGEATHPHYYSTVHGAVETGWREADRIISSYKL